jgi:hypothetical protein
MRGTKGNNTRISSAAKYFPLLLIHILPISNF